MSAKKRKVPVWTWRQAVARTEVPTLTKALCWALSNYLSDVGKGCFPGTKLLMADTGMSNWACAEHLKRAVAAGLLVTKRERSRDGRIKRTVYYPTFPDHVELPNEPASFGDADNMSDTHEASPSEGNSFGPGESGHTHHVSQPHGNTSNRELSKERGAQARPRSRFSLNADWKLPDVWHAWATKESPDHAHMIEGDAKKFKAHWRGKQRACTEAEWEAEWQKWFLRTAEQPARRAHKGNPKSAGGQWDFGVSVRDTSKPWKEEYSEYQARQAKVACEGR